MDTVNWICLNFDKAQIKCLSVFNVILKSKGTVKVILIKVTQNGIGNNSCEDFYSVVCKSQ